MVLVNEIRAKMTLKGYTVSYVAKKLGISDKTLYNRFKEGRFYSNEMQALIEVLDIKDPERIFFAKEVSQHVTNHST